CARDPSYYHYDISIRYYDVW
nr:immunoglobulin heavy chain junction region [Macaca mulatta]MOV37845.1 immunoglobulin heavy chain junction region [Macaca mulatta]MOV38331.1 immunoglobulin heavy chain junction region [Macaca mulatta]MOV38869.1 immunoglobulin heavy chain junction region [Macaca mulatta]MOV39162.1 immunoglobulin heavy chain junction region [Macaca mulatta]